MPKTVTLTENELKATCEQYAGQVLRNLALAIARHPNARHPQANIVATIFDEADKYDRLAKKTAQIPAQ